MLIDSRNLFPIPDTMTFEQAALLEPLSVGIWACKRANLMPVATVNRYNNTWPIAIELVASGRVDVNPLITHHFTLAQTADAITVGERETTSVKAIIHPQQL